MLAAQSSSVSGIVFTVAVLATSLALVPSGTGPGPVEAIRGVRSAIARSRRYWQISRIAVRHGLRPYLRGRRRDQDAPGGQAALALSLRRALEEGGIRATVEQDLDILLRLAVRLERRAHWARAVGAVGLARGFAGAMREELDFRIEARNMAAVAATWPGQQKAIGHGVSVVLPAVHAALCSEQVLVIEWLDGGQPARGRTADR
jgi:hypothetical protein